MTHYCALIQCLVILAFGFGASGVDAANRLAGHPSPYLELHAGDPVDWRPWQADVFSDAREKNQLVFVSIGYFSCHWCHVMQQESYQDPGIAKILNANYVSVKVDRELDPDLDQRLIDFVERTRGSAGWPLNVFLTPEGYPVTGFTYLPRDNFAAVLEQLDRKWRQDHAELKEAAREFFQTQMQGRENQALTATRVPTARLVDAFLSQAMMAADELQGGFGDTTRFPSVPQLNAMIDAIRRDSQLDPDVADFVKLTLRVMASENLHDHVNGGFFRYTTDPDWQTPHFEKMLYDNALLARLYLEAHQLWPDQGYSDTAQRTLDFVDANLKHPDGGYMSSLSAVDRENREGGAYFWNEAQLSRLLEADELKYLLELRQAPSPTGDFLIEPLAGSAASGDASRNRAILRKLQTRGSASMPADDKRLASWNAMMLEALTAASDVAPRFAERARALFASMQENFYRDGTLIRFAGNADVAAAVLEDYAQVARAFNGFGRKFDDKAALAFARLLTEAAHALFLKQGRWQQKAEPLIPITRGKWIIPDLVFYSPMTLWLETALDTPGLNPAVRRTADEMLQRASREMLESPYFYGSLIMLRASRAH